MPKIDTLDALGDAMTTILIINLTANLQNMPKTFPRYPKFVPKLVRRNAHAMPHAQIVPKICPRYAEDIVKSQKHE